VLESTDAWYSLGRGNSLQLGKAAKGERILIQNGEHVDCKKELLLKYPMKLERKDHCKRGRK